MAGLLGDWLGDNPMYQGFDQRRNAIGQFGVGLMQGKNLQEGLALGGAGALDGRRFDDANALRVKQEEQRLGQINQTVEYMRSKGFDDLVAGVEGGGLDIGTAWTEALRRGQPQSDGSKPIEINGQLVDPSTGQVIGDYRSPETPSYPAAYQEHLLAQQDPSFAAARAQTSAPMNSTIQKELFDTEDAVAAGGYVMSALDNALELNKSAADGAWAGQRATIGANIPDVGIFNGDQTDQATIQYQNTVNELALNQLKTIFGAAPTEGERKILLEIQGSVEQPRAVREQILMRAKQMAERRIAEAQAKAAGLRSGQYFQPGYGQQTPGGQTTGGVQWSIE